MRRESPVLRDPTSGVWMVFGFDDVRTALSDHSRFSSDFSRLSGGDRSGLGASVISTDPPRHRQLRSLVTQAFTPKAVEALRPRIEEIVDELLDGVAARGRLDVVEDLAYPLPVIVIAEMLGIPSADRARFKRWSDDVVAPPSGLDDIELTSAHYEMGAYFMQLLNERRDDPREDLISALLAAEIEGERLSEIELVGFCMLLLVAGNETTTNLIANAILCFDEHPAATAALRSNPQLLPGAIEEVLRHRSPVQSMFRVTTEPVELSGTRIPPDQSVVAWIGSANRDPAQFPAADQFQIDRSPNRHLAFGHGIHFCLGAPLARLEARVALSAILGRLGEFRVDRDVQLEALPGTIVYGVRSLPVTFGPE
jgi:cytochrome P450